MCKDYITEMYLGQSSELGSEAKIERNIIDKIEADAVTVEVLDKTTGKIYRRNLLIHYLETGNGVLLSGETMEGKPSTIAFLSENALRRINDLVGKGPDIGRCE